MQCFNNFLAIFWVFYGILLNLLKIRRKWDTNKRLDGKVVVITGGNTGLGKETAYQLSLRGAKIIIACRDVNKAENAIKDIKAKNPSADICVLRLDLSSLTSVRQFAKSVAEQEFKIDILINNAGIMNCPEWTTEDGFEMQFGTNHLGHFLLTLSLMKLLKKSTNARIVNVSAALYVLGKIHFDNINLRNNAYTARMGYFQSKLANILFTRELAKRLGPKSNINAYSLHPGVILTDLARHSSKLAKPFVKLMTISPEMGVKTTLYCALEESLDNESGFYYDDCRRVNRMHSNATDDESAKNLWELSCDLVKLEDHLKI